MNAPLQIGSALLLVTAAAAWPLYLAMGDAAALQSQLDHNRTRESAATLSRQATVTAASAPGKQGKLPPINPERIPEGVSAAEANLTISMLKELDGKAVPGRRIAELCQRIISLPASHLEEAFAAVQGGKNIPISVMLSAALFSRWGEMDPEGARKKIADLNKGANPIMQGVAQFSAAPGWFERDPQGFLAFVKDNKEGGREGRDMLRMLLEMGSVTDPSSQRMLIDAAPEEDRPGLIISAAAKDPKSDLEGAIIEGLSLTKSGQASDGRMEWRLREGISSLVQRDPAKAEAFINGNKLTDEQKKLALPAYGQALIAKDEKQGLVWAAKQSPEEQAKIFNDSWRYRDWDFEKADTAAAKLAPEAGNQLREASLRGLASRDPSKASTHIESLPEEKQPEVSMQVSTEWTRNDPMAASEWVKGMPEGRNRDFAINGLTTELMEKEPDSAVIWASTMTDEKMRQESLTQSFPKWMKRDPDAAQAWLTGSNLAPETQQTLLEAKDEPAARPGRPRRGRPF